MILPVFVNDEQFEKLIDKNKYQVFVFAYRASFPLIFSTHSWLVVNNKGKISRWEIFWRPQKNWKNRWGHLHKDFYTPLEGIPAFFFTKKIHWNKFRLLGLVEGKNNSVAHKMVRFIENSPRSYPYRNRYRLTGPNSNTYIQWVLDSFPEFKVQLPWNAFGKNF